METLNILGNMRKRYQGVNEIIFCSKVNIDYFFKVESTSSIFIGNLPTSSIFIGNLPVIFNYLLNKITGNRDNRQQIESDQKRTEDKD